MRYVGFDCETYKIENQVMPEIVCCTFYDGTETLIFKQEEGLAYLLDLLKDSKTHVIAHNANFDMICASVLNRDVFYWANRAYKQKRVHCTKIREIMLNCADERTGGDYKGMVPGTKKGASRSSLAGCVYCYFNKDITMMKGGDSWRLRYSELMFTDLCGWPAEAVSYAKDDAVFARDVFFAQNERKVVDLTDATRQAYAEYVLMYMAGVLGVRINDQQIKDARDVFADEHDQAIVSANAIKEVYKKNPKKKRKWQRDDAARAKLFESAYAILRYDEPGIYTEKGKISTASDTRKKLISVVEKCFLSGRNWHQMPLSDTDKVDLETILKCIEHITLAEGTWKDMNSFIDALSNASLNRDHRLRYQYHGLVATGRTSSSSPNMQNLPRKDAIRKCVIPRQGYIFAVADYSNAEMRTLAQAILTERIESELAKEYQKDPLFDPHLYAAWKLHMIETGEDITYEEVKARKKDFKKKRTLCKILNFGLAGGLSHVSFVTYAQGFGVDLTMKESKRLCDAWLEVWGEMKDYFNKRKNIDIDPRRYTFAVSRRSRFLEKYTVACNTPFQGIAADGAKDALIFVFWECFFEKKSPLFGCKPILFVHDEIVLEVPDDQQKASKAAKRLQELMETGMQRHTPDIPAVAEAHLTRVWTKDAESEEVNGVLSVYE